jgi:Family of unknown function (DUF5309)
MSTLGIFNTSNQAPSAVKPSFSNTILRKAPSGNATLLGITSRLKQKNITNIRHSWFTQEYFHANFKLAAAAPAVARGVSQALTVEDSSSIVVGMTMMFHPIQEQVLVVGVVGDIVTVRRGIGNIAPVPLSVGSSAYVIGTAFEESSLRPVAISESYKELFNQTQIFRSSWAVSGSAAEQELQVQGSVDADNPNAAMNRIARNMEESIIFGEQLHKPQLLNGQPIRRMDGLISMIQKGAPQNYMISSGAVTFDQLDAMLDPLFDIVTDDSGMNDRLILTDKVGLKVINDLGKYYGVVQTAVGQSAFGHQFRDFTTNRGTFKVMEHPLFNVLPQARGMLLVTDLSSLCMPVFRPMSYGTFNDKLGKTTYEAQDNGIDAKGGSFLTEVTFECSAPEANGVIVGLQTAVCKPCVTGPQLYQATFTTSHPCNSGEVAPGTVVTLTVTGAAPGKVIKLTGVSSVIEMTADANGFASVTQTIGTDASYVFEILPNQDNMNTAFLGSVVTVCVTQPCDDAAIPNDPTC